MRPKFFNLAKDECVQVLRQLELEAYSVLVSALRAQGPLNQEKRKILKETGKILNISTERHKAEIRRAVNDEKLNTLAYHVHGPGVSPEDWCQEGRRMLPMLQRISPQTLHPIITEENSFVRDESERNMFENDEQIYGDENVDSDAENKPEMFHHAGQKTLINNAQQFGQSDPEKSIFYATKKTINKGQKLRIVSNTQSILQKTLSVPLSKVHKLNLDKFKIVPNSSHLSSIQLSALPNNSLKHKLISSKTGKRIIPISQLQLLNQRLNTKTGIKVLPLNGKLLGKNITMTRILPGRLPKGTLVSSNRVQEIFKFSPNMEESKIEETENGADDSAEENFNAEPDDDKKEETMAEERDEIEPVADESMEVEANDFIEPEAKELKESVEEK